MRHNKLAFIPLGSQIRQFLFWEEEKGMKYITIGMLIKDKPETVEGNLFCTDALPDREGSVRYGSAHDGHAAPTPWKVAG